MTNKPRASGTAAETAVLRFLRETGLTVDRRAPAGKADTGDLWVDHGRAVIEVKTRNRPHTPHDVHSWLAELDTEVINACAAGAAVDVCALVVKRLGSGARSAGDWHVYAHLPDVMWLATGSGLLMPTADGWWSTRLVTFRHLLTNRLRPEDTT